MLTRTLKVNSKLIVAAILSLVLLLAVLVSCSGRWSKWKTLQRIEPIVWENPDSALRALSDFTFDESVPTRVKARHALLTSMAMQGSGIIADSDSAARLAFDYYASHGSSFEKMHAANCLAEIEYEYGRMTDAIVHYHTALRVAVERSDVRMEGYICQRLGELFALNYDHEESLSYARRAESCLLTAGEPISAAFSALDQARQYLALENTSRAWSIADSLSQSNCFHHAGFDYYLYLLKANLSAATHDEKAALHYYDSAGKTGYSLPLNSLAGYLLLIQQQGSQTEVDSLLNQMRGRVRTGIDSIVYQGVLMEQSRLKGDYKQAFHHQMVMTDIQNRSYTSVISRSATRALKAYFQEQYTLERERRKSQILSLTLVILLLGIGVAVSLILLRHRRKRLEEEMSLVETLSHDVQLMEIGKRRSDTVIATMVQDKIKTMNQLTDTYFSWTSEAVQQREMKNGRSSKEEIINSFRHELKDLRSDTRFLQSIEEALNQSQGQIMRRLRADFSGLEASVPKFKESDFHFVMLLFAGFSNRSVSFFMDMTDEAVRSKKKRCKQCFLSLPDGRGLQYAELL